MQVSAAWFTRLSIPHPAKAKGWMATLLPLLHLYCLFGIPSKTKTDRLQASHQRSVMLLAPLSPSIHTHRLSFVAPVADQELCNVNMLQPLSLLVALHVTLVGRPSMTPSPQWSVMLLYPLG